MAPADVGKAGAGLAQTRAREISVIGPARDLEDLRDAAATAPKTSEFAQYGPRVLALPKASGFRWPPTSYPRSSRGRRGRPRVRGRAVATSRACGPS